MISLQTFETARSHFGYQSSWALWGEFGERPKDNMEDLSMFEAPKLSNTLQQLHTKFVIVGLNISTIEIKTPLSNFHGKNGEVYKLRYALKNTPLWGAYMTDVIKDYRETEALKVDKYLTTPEGKQFEEENVMSFDRELKILGAQSAILISLGASVHKILCGHFARATKIIKIDHYGYPISKERYRERVLASLKEKIAI